MEMTFFEWIEFCATITKVAIVVLPICIVIILVEMVRLIVWYKKVKEERDE